MTRRLLVSVALAATAGTAAGSTAVPAAADVRSPAAAGRLALPAPTGPHPVGKDTLFLRDGARPDPWMPHRMRELMVSLWYPAPIVAGRAARYVTAEESRRILASGGLTDVPPDLLSTTRTHALAGAPPVPRRHALPLVVLSPGFTMPRSSLTALGEELASRGYVVAAVDHTYESVAVTLPDGTVTGCVACEQDPKGPDVAAGRAADVSFVLDRLTGPRPAWHGSRFVDPARIAMVGHSMGGAAAATTMLADPRVRAGVNLDGTFHPDDIGRNLDRPFLMIGNDARHRPGGPDPSWDTTWQRFTGWKRWLTVAGTEHASFTDYSPLREQIDGVGLPGEPISGRRAVQVTRAYVATFLDHHLRGAPAPLLDAPTPQYPEVRWWLFKDHQPPVGLLSTTANPSR